MPPVELLHRARVTLRDRLAPPAYAGWPPAEAYPRLFSGDPGRIVLESPLRRLARVETSSSDDLAATLAAARELLAGRWSLFGHAVTLENPPRWNRDPISGAEWPDVPSGRIDYRHAPVGGPKPVWELGRLTVLPTLAAAWRLTEEAAFAKHAQAWLDDWAAREPLGHGVHYTSGIEMAVRVITVGWTLMLLAERASTPGLASSLGLLAQQALHCRDHLSLESSANNHLIAEYAAMAVMGSGFPSLRGAESFARDGHAGLEREVMRQIHPDGVPAEQAFGYLPFVWELLLAGLLAGEVAGRPISAPVRERLRVSLELARAIRLPDGRWPQFGDEDDGRVLLAAESASRLDLVGNALAAWLDVEGLSDRDQGLALLLTGRRAPTARVAADGRHEFAAGGYTVWRERGLHVTFDHGALGLPPIAAHGHADALSLTLARGNDAVLADPGTFAYQEDAEARDRCRATPAHSTVHFGGRSQSEMLGPFLWGERARVLADGGAWECVWADGARHRRRVEVRGDRVTIEDRARGEGAELTFALAPGARIELAGRRATITIGGTRAVFELDGGADWRVVPGEYAAGFGRRESAPRLAAQLSGESCRTSISLASL
jgi:hypothetical protein